jgi:hypothetical protein
MSYEVASAIRASLAGSRRPIEHGTVDDDRTRQLTDQPVDAHFEAAVDAIVSGGPDALHALLETDPALVRARSPFGHHATLVHYVAANGVESTVLKVKIGGWWAGQLERMVGVVERCALAVIPRPRSSAAALSTRIDTSY